MSATETYPLVSRARDLLDRCEAAWPNPPVYIGRILHKNGSDVKDYLREAIGFRPEFLEDAIENAEVALGDRCVECGDEMTQGRGHTRVCSRECAREHGGEFV